MLPKVLLVHHHHLRHHRDACMPQDPYRKPDLRGRPLLHALYWLRTLLILPAWVVRGFWGSAAVFIPALRAPYARALLQDAPILILDEATEGLAPVVRQEIWAAIRALKGQGMSSLKRKEK